MADLWTANYVQEISEEYSPFYLTFISLPVSGYLQPIILRKYQNSRTSTLF